MRKIVYTFATLVFFNALIIKGSDEKEPLRINVNLEDINADIDLSLGGWIRIDYGVGTDRFGARKGSDRLGVSQYAMVTNVQFSEDIALVGVVGGTVFSDGTSDDFDIRDAFMVWDNLFGFQNLTFKAGAQPILFGLKPNGYPGDHSLQPSVEYGAAGLFAVSQQAGPSVLLLQPFEIMDSTLSGTVSVGAFDHDTENDTLDDGSSIADNYFAQVKFDRVLLEGLYAVLGIENRYVGGRIDSSEPIVDIGIGFGNELFDASFEYIHIDEDLLAPAILTDNEAYYVAEFAVNPFENVSLYFDWARAQEANVETYRLGMSCDIESWLNFKLEVSQDNLKRGEDPESVDARITLTF